MRTIDEALDGVDGGVVQRLNKMPGIDQEDIVDACVLVWDYNGDEVIEAVILTASQFINVRLKIDSQRGPVWSTVRYPLKGFKFLGLGFSGIKERTRLTVAECSIDGLGDLLEFKENRSGSHAYHSGGYREAFNRFFSELARSV